MKITVYVVLTLLLAQATLQQADKCATADVNGRCLTCGANHQLAFENVNSSTDKKICRLCACGASGTESCLAESGCTLCPASMFRI